MSAVSNSKNKSQNLPVVMKFGGTSVGNPDRIRATAERVKDALAACPRLVVVVSAMSGQTDHLLNLGRGFNDSNSIESLRELDSLAATGEQVSAALLALALQNLGVRAQSFTAHQVTIDTDGRYQRARIRRIDSKPLIDAIENGVVCVVTGFQGTDGRKNIVTLGRGGSDTSAVALAIAVKARLCEIYTDVDGVYTADPRMVPDARKIKTLSFDEMLELASTGAKVLMIRSVEIAMKHRLNFSVRSSFNNSDGTIIMDHEQNLEEPVVSGLSHDLHQAKVTITGLPADPSSLTAALAPLAEDDISVDFITQNIGSDGHMTLAFSIDEKMVDLALASLRKRFQSSSPAVHLEVDQPLAKVSAVGIGMRTHAGVAYRFFSTLTEQNVPIKMALSTEIRVSALISSADCQRALQALHREFFQ